VTIEPFTLPVHADEAAWIRDRVAGYRFFEEPVDAGWNYGANRDYMERLRTYWLDSFDWPAAVAGLNRHPHFRVEVEPDLRLHCIHRRSSRADARPLLIARSSIVLPNLRWRKLRPSMSSLLRWRGMRGRTSRRSRSARARWRGTTTG
jgi:hypothetical protein